MPQSSRLSKIDVFYLAYFILHIPITILIDSNIVVPREYQFEICKTLIDFHVTTNKDVLFYGARPVWFQVFGAVELLFQLPLFVYCSLQLWSQTKKHYVWMIIYGFNASFTTLVCLFQVVSLAGDHGLSSGETTKLIGLYVPYLLIPFGILVDYSRRVNKELLKEKTD